MADSPRSGNRIPSQRVVRWLVIAGAALYLSLFLVNSLTRTRHFAPDSMNYVDVARNIAAGKGIVQSTLGYNQALLFDDDSRIPAAYTSQAPLYPVVIALLGRLGLSFPDAGLVIPVIAYAWILLLAYFLARDLYGETAAALSAACLVGYFPLTHAARRAWSDPVGAAFLLLFLLLLARSRRSERTTGKIARIGWLLAGLGAGLAFSTRYSLWPVFLLGILFLAMEHRGLGSTSRILLYAAGAALPAALVLGHNLSAAGYLMPPMLASDLPLSANLRDAAFSFLGSYSRTGSGTVQAIAALAAVAACAAALVAQRRSREILGVLLADGRYLLTLWFLLYSGSIICLRTASHFDIITSRMMLPAGIIMVVMAAALAVKASERKLPGKWVFRAILIAAILLACVREARIMATQPIPEADARIAESERLSWVAHQTTDRDLVIGDNSVDIPFYFPGRAAVSFSWYPYNVRLTHEMLAGFSDRNCDKYRNIYLVLRIDEVPTHDEHIHRFGQFITDLRLNNTVLGYPDIVPVARLRDASVFQVLCNRSGRQVDG